MYIIPMWKVFTKAGKPGWLSIIPFYNISVLFEISGMNPLLILLVLFSLFIPVVKYIVFTIIFILTNIKLAQKFNKGNAFAVGLILLNPVFMWILGFDKSRYQY